MFFCFQEFWDLHPGCLSALICLFSFISCFFGAFVVLARRLQIRSSCVTPRTAMSIASPIVCDCAGLLDVCVFPSIVSSAGTPNIFVLRTGSVPRSFQYVHSNSSPCVRFLGSCTRAEAQMIADHIRARAFVVVEVPVVVIVAALQSVLALCVTSSALLFAFAFAPFASSLCFGDPSSRNSSMIRRTVLAPSTHLWSVFLLLVL